eukprot:3222732-Pyramimonas_sp.AAC.1
MEMAAETSLTWPASSMIPRITLGAFGWSSLQEPSWVAMIILHLLQRSSLNFRQLLLLLDLLGSMFHARR